MASILAVARAATSYADATAFQAGNCASDARPSYTVTVCLTTPSAGSVISGMTPAQATVSVTGANPGVRRLIFYVDNQYALTAFGLPYAFDLPTGQWVDGAHTLAVEALLRDNFTTSRAAASLTFANGVSAPPVNNNAFQVTSGFSNLGRPLIVAATG
ncbi:MAG TPA: Ig-like domain-containing protein, partial [Caldilinea sp.]|nr:Ig-like domain-containing protein [Caldilinea sp.]